MLDLHKDLIELLSAIETDYGKIKQPGELYTRDMTEHPLSEAVITRLIKVYNSGYFLISDL